jgi:hypothetical protein
MFFPNSGRDYESHHKLDNEALSLQVEDLDEFTAIEVRIGENGEVVFAH